MIAGTIQPRLIVGPRRCNDQDVPFPGSVGSAHPRIDRRLRVIFHVNDSVRGREWVDHQKIAVTLENLERKVMVGYAWDSQHVALRFRVRRRPIGAVQRLPDTVQVGTIRYALWTLRLLTQLQGLSGADRQQ